MTVRIGPLRSEDDVLEAHRLETDCYPPDAAASYEAFVYRYRTFPAFFLGAWDGERLVGLACGVRTDARDCSDVSLKRAYGGDADGRRLCVLSVAVAPDRRGEGIGEALVQRLAAQAAEQRLDGLLLMCQEPLKRWYARFGFAETGLVHDEHAGIRWHEMVRPLSPRPPA